MKITRYKDMETIQDIQRNSCQEVTHKGTCKRKTHILNIRSPCTLPDYHQSVTAVTVAPLEAEWIILQSKIRRSTIIYHVFLAD